MFKICLFVIFLLCSGCSFSIDNSNINAGLNNIFIHDKAIEVAQNNFTEYYDYYLPSDIQELEFSDLAFSFAYQNSKTIININVSSILCNTYYEEKVLLNDEIFDASKQIYSYQGKFVDAKEELEPFLCVLYEYEEDYFLYIKSSKLCVYSYIVDTDVVELVDKIFNIMKSVDIEEELLISNYSNKDVIDYHKQALKLFDIKMPESGVIEDLLLEDQVSE